MVNSTQNAAKKTYVAIVIDRSGSMMNIRKEAWKGLNEQIRTIKENADKGGDTKVTIVQFDNEYEILRNNVSADVIHEIDESEYEPRGSTALLDAVGKTVSLLEKQEQTHDTGFLVIVISDGEENASTEWSSDKLKSKVSELEQTGRWTFTYMLSNVDMYAVAQELGAHLSNMLNYTADSAGTANVFSCNSAATSTYFTSTRAVGATHTSTFYNQTDSPLTGNSKK